jgi:LysM repeat protein
MSSGFSRTIALLMIAIAIIMAAGVFLAISVVRSRNSQTEAETAANNFWVTVGAEQIALQVDPNLRPNIVDAPIIDDTPRVETPPDQPVDQQIIETTILPEATAVPAIEQPAVVPATTSEKIIFIDYFVQQGDTLYSISNRLDTSIALMADKGISHASLVPGQTIRLPIGNPAYCAGRGRPYAIGEGDTVFNISQRFNTTPANLQAINGLDANYAIRIADIICIP